jgi:hypothetical protein
MSGASVSTPGPIGQLSRQPAQLQRTVIGHRTAKPNEAQYESHRLLRLPLTC